MGVRSLRVSLGFGMVLAFVVMAASGAEDISPRSALADNIPQSELGEWRDSGVIIQEANYGTCLDGKHPDMLFVSNNLDGIGTVAYNLTTGERAVVNKLHYDRKTCGKNGFLYASDNADSPESGQHFTRFSLEDPQGESIAYLPSYVAEDGSLQVYSFGYAAQPRLMASSDGGLTWDDRGTQLEGNIETYAASTADARCLYVVVSDPVPPPINWFESPARDHRIYYSSDTGITWTLKTTLHTDAQDAGVQDIGIRLPAGSPSPVGTLVVIRGTSSYGSSHYYADIYLSTDGGQTLTNVGYSNGYDLVDLFKTDEGILRWRLHNNVVELSLTSNGGTTWQVLPSPGDPQRGMGEPIVPRNAPWTVLVSAPDVFFNNNLYVSEDGGHTWEHVKSLGSLVSSSLPLTVIGGIDNRVYTLDLPNSGRKLVAPVTPLGIWDGTYFPETGHNLFGTLHNYWDDHGGLSQFGYPITERFPEVSRADGKVYTVQYFERAVLELHPENQPPYNVLLSLLGAEAYKQKYGALGAPSQHASIDNQFYFAETGHTIGGKFREYWESHGGLAQQGYPISDEFAETSETDGKPYTVQYFQRARFELHPENAGTPNEVLLGQLGTAQFKARYGASEP